MSIPRDPSFDTSAALLREGYTFVARRAWRLGSDVFGARVMLRDAVFMVGAEASRQFYEPGRFTRQRALPPTTLTLLLDKGSVQLLDGEAHRGRKHMFMSMMTPAALARMSDTVGDVWRQRLPGWSGRGEVVLLEEVEEVLCRAACAWAGVPLDDGEATARTREMAAMIDGAGSIGPRNWRGQLLRRRTERWAGDLVRRVRSGELEVPSDRALSVIASHRDVGGELLPPPVAAVELINVLRPTVAVARFVTFAALALHDHPHAAPGPDADDDTVEAFVQEVRRFYPLFPMVGGRVLQPFDWRGHHFAKGTWVLLDLYGTNHDPRRWDEPETFRPERFERWEPNPFDFVPQGGGDFDLGHRCAGEWLTIAITKTAVRLLTAMRYDVPPQDLHVSLARMPTAPASGFVIDHVRPSEEGYAAPPPPSLPVQGA